MDAAMLAPMDQHPAVSLILIADTLLAHYLDVVRRISNALRSRDEDEFSVQVGDANRAYPGIWDHLDQARRMLAAERRDVAQYDAIRAQQGHSTHAGVKDIEYSEWRVDVARSIAHLGLSMSQTITVQLNVTGAVYAYHASEALKAALSEVDWAALKKAADAPVADLKRGWTKWAAGAAIGIAIVITWFLVR
jgi:hypothetical protein